jgi:predicted permease
MLGLLYLLHRIGWRATDLWPWPAQLIVLTAGTPSAINVLILTLEVGGDAELTADCVFWTTVVSCLTITGWLMVVRWGM